jgi:hypothetical protein
MVLLGFTLFEKTFALHDAGGKATHGTVADSELGKENL